MRPRRASASNGTVDRRVRLSLRSLLVGAMAVVALWVTGSLSQELGLNRSLNDQVAAMRQQNASVGTTNDAYRKDIAAISSGAAAEEEARRDGYARSNEKLYLIATPPPAPAAATRTQPSPSGGLLDALRHLLGH